MHAFDTIGEARRAWKQLEVYDSHQPLRSRELGTAWARGVTDDYHTAAHTTVDRGTTPSTPLTKPGLTDVLKASNLHCTSTQAGTRDDV
jgi:hypothetical protein